MRGLNRILGTLGGVLGGQIAGRIGLRLPPPGWPSEPPERWPHRWPQGGTPPFHPNGSGGQESLAPREGDAPIASERPDGTFDEGFDTGFPGTNVPGAGIPGAGGISLDPSIAVNGLSESIALGTKREQFNRFLLQGALEGKTREELAQDEWDTQARLTAQLAAFRGAGAAGVGTPEVTMPEIGMPEVGPEDAAEDPAVAAGLPPGTRLFASMDGGAYLGDQEGVPATGGVPMTSAGPTDIVADDPRPQDPRVSEGAGAATTATETAGGTTGATAGATNAAGTPTAPTPPAPGSVADLERKRDEYLKTLPVFADTEAQRIRDQAEARRQRRGTAPTLDEHPQGNTAQQLAILLTGLLGGDATSAQGATNLDARRRAAARYSNERERYQDEEAKRIEDVSATIGRAGEVHTDAVNRHNANLTLWEAGLAKIEDELDRARKAEGVAKAKAEAEAEAKRPPELSEQETRDAALQKAWEAIPPVKQGHLARLEHLIFSGKRVPPAQLTEYRLATEALGLPWLKERWATRLFAEAVRDGNSRTVVGLAEAEASESQRKRAEAERRVPIAKGDERAAAVWPKLRDEDRRYLAALEQKRRANARHPGTYTGEDRRRYEAATAKLGLGSAPPDWATRLLERDRILAGTRPLPAPAGPSRGKVGAKTGPGASGPKAVGPGASGTRPTAPKSAVPLSPSEPPAPRNVDVVALRGGLSWGGRPVVDVARRARGDAINGTLARELVAAAAASGVRITIGTASTGHSARTKSRNPSRHVVGDAVDIVAIDGIPIADPRARAKWTRFRDELGRRGYDWNPAGETGHRAVVLGPGWPGKGHDDHLHVSRRGR